MKPRIQVLYEHGADGLPYASSYLRLIRPLGYPGVADHFHVTFSPVYCGEAEIVIVDRLWHSRATLADVEQLVSSVRAAHARLVYALDDQYLHLPVNRAAMLPTDYREIIHLLLGEADALLTTTPTLAEQLGAYTRRVFVISNALDERLIAQRASFPIRPTRASGSARASGAIVLGYMGTPTHDEDLQSIASALALAAEHCPLPLRLEIIGGIEARQTRGYLQTLPLTLRFLEPPNPLYPSFLAWFTGQVRWDIALAPLVDIPFNRAKSDVKFLDYSALGAASIYSREPVYGQSVQHKVTGWLADATVESWTEAITTLVAHPELRRELVANARRHLFGSRILAHRVQDWVAALETVWYG